jgi:hypothetical protein
MVKIMIAVVLIMLGSGAWLALDYLNKQEQARAMEMHLGIDKARAEAQKRNQRMENFKIMIQDNQNSCEAAAEQAQHDYLALMLKVIPAKRKSAPVIPQAIMNEAATMMASAKEACLQLATAQLQKGF